VLIRLTPTEAMALAAVVGVEVPPIVTSVVGDGDVVRVTVDLGKADDLPAPLKLAARAAPIAHAEVRVLGLTRGVVTLGLEIHAARLPVSKLLGLLSRPIKSQLAAQGLPRDAVDIHPDKVVVDVDALLAEKAPGVSVNEVKIMHGEVVVRASVG
jgi:hypothetical protein